MILTRLCDFLKNSSLRRRSTAEPRICAFTAQPDFDSVSEKRNFFDKFRRGFVYIKSNYRGITELLKLKFLLYSKKYAARCTGRKSGTGNADCLISRVLHTLHRFVHSLACARTFASGAYAVYINQTHEKGTNCAKSSAVRFGCSVRLIAPARTAERKRICASMSRGVTIIRAPEAASVTVGTPRE